MKRSSMIRMVLGIMLMVPGLCSFSQVGISTTNSQPDGSAILDVASTSKGMLIPRMTSGQRTGITSAAIGLLVYQTDGIPGFYYYNGSAWMFLGDGDGGSNNVIDIDGNGYRTVRIGNQEWMAENLRVVHYRNGEAITLVTDNSAWTSQSTGALCWYNNDEAANKIPYGAIYNWYAMNDSRKICPSGWHVPNDAEWNTMLNYCGGPSVAGGVMKAALLWNPPNTGASNTFGFSSFPSGYRSGDDGGFYNLGIAAGGWSSTDHGSYGWGFNPTNASAAVSSGTVGKTYGLGVRCIRDY
jgi:uncharacterized protein (TIGR02145 family)